MWLVLSVAIKNVVFFRYFKRASERREDDGLFDFVCLPSLACSLCYVKRDRGCIIFKPNSTNISAILFYSKINFLWVLLFKNLINIKRLVCVRCCAACSMFIFRLIFEIFFFYFYVQKEHKTIFFCLPGTTSSVKKFPFFMFSVLLLTTDSKQRKKKSTWV